MGLQEDKERVREATDIVDVISKVVALKPSGKNLKGLCPFHQEKTPSFFVDPDRQRYHCFGCQADGDVFEFIMKSDGLDFKQALTTLAGQANIPLTPSGSRPIQDEAKQKRLRQLREVLTWAHERFESAMYHPQVGQVARSYINKRGLTDAISRKFGLGFAPTGRHNLIKAAQRDHYSLALLQEAGLILKKDEQSEPYDRFRNRLIFPIHDVQGLLLGFGGRVIGAGEPKYLNSPESPIYHKGDHLYGLNAAKDHARQLKQLILVEGYLDVMACVNAGVNHTVGSLGTALTPKQAKLLKRYSREVILLYDTDQAGIQAACRAFELINQEQVTVKAVNLAPAKDPDEYIQRFGNKAFQTILQQAVHFITYMLERACEQNDLGSIEGKIKIKNEMVELIIQLEDRSLQFEYTKQLAMRLSQPVQIIDEEVNKALKLRRRRQSRAQPAPIDSVATQVPAEQEIALTQAPKEEKLLIAMLLRFPTQIELVKEKLNVETITHSLHRQLIHTIYEMPVVDPDEEEVWLPAFLNNEQVDSRLREYAEQLVKEDKGEEDPWPVILDCMKRLMRTYLRTKAVVLQRQIQLAATDDDKETRTRLLQQKFELDNQIRDLGVLWK